MATKTKKPERLFKRRVGIAAGVSVDVTRESTDDEETILAWAGPGEAFGGWDDGATGLHRWPAQEDVEKAVSEALGFEVLVDGWSRQDDGSLRIEFLRASEANEESPAAAIVDAFAEARPAQTPAANGQPNGQVDEHDLIERIRAAERACQETEAAWKLSKEQTAQRKAAYEYRVERLRALCRNLGPDAWQEGLGKAAEENHETTGSRDSEPAEDLSWRAVPLSQALAQLPAGVLQKLAEAELATMGQLADYCNAKSDFSDPYQTIPGIGKTKAEQIREAEAAFWERRKAQAPAPAPAVESTEEDEEAE